MGLCMLYVFGLYGWMCGIAWDGIHRMREWVYFVESFGVSCYIYFLVHIT